jgi:DNA-binding HxlR family transcriptional regulator
MLLSKCKHDKVLIMPNIEINRRSNCPISFTLDAFGDKWTLLVLRDIMFYDRTRFSDFMPVEQVATNILADRLSKLETMGMVTKERDPKLKNQFIYQATPVGQSLLPVLVEMTLWGLEHDPESLASKEFLERAQDEKAKVTREITRAVKRGNFTAYRSEKMGINPR